MAIAPGEPGKMDSKLHNGDLDPEPKRQDVGTRSLWRGAARFVFAVLCLVVASLAGSASNRVSPVQIGAPDATPSADAQRDSSRNLLRLHAEIVTQGASWRSIDPGGPRPDPHSPALVPLWQGVAWLAESGVGSVSSHDHAPPWLAVRAGYPRAPPTTIVHSRTAA